jgi:signal transduction histidine kinase
MNVSNHTFNSFKPVTTLEMRNVKPDIEEGQEPTFVMDQLSRHVLNVNQSAKEELGIKSPVGENFDSLLEAPQDFNYSDPILINRKWYQMEQKAFDWEGDAYTKVTFRHIRHLSTEPLIHTIRDLIAVLANRLRSPLTAMQGYLDLRDEEHDVNSDRFNEKFGAGIEQLFEIIDDLEELHHTSDKPIENLRNASCKTEEVLNELLFEYPAEDRNRIQVRAPRNEGKINCSEEEFREIMTCLIDNALEHPSGKEFDVHVDLRSPRYIRVTNSGKPIDESLKEKIFLPFSTTKASSMGIGLTKAQMLANRQNGILWLTENSEEMGITFTLCLPA